MNEIDYKKLLMKYIAHVGQCESVTYLESHFRGYSDINFTDDEWNHLGLLSEESRKYDT